MPVTIVGPLATIVFALLNLLKTNYVKCQLLSLDMCLCNLTPLTILSSPQLEPVLTRHASFHTTACQRSNSSSGDVSADL